ncbi:hypothetical protein [Burkholderia sp. SRS-W-2-2016]|uniref:hypothetical protein n=1 Tax=Burkholderia sp. SRS-W-2-2016 TaxID=1926878 RepID=UPI001180AE49|nr:hypothetical protein [Burkholderia sp. SRS-W-2-2016]
MDARRQEQRFEATLTGAMCFALGMVVPVNFLLIAGAAQARKALGLHGATGIVVGLVAAVVVAAAATLGVLFLLDWAYHRINAAYAAAEQRAARNGGAA